MNTSVVLLLVALLAHPALAADSAHVTPDGSVPTRSAVASSPGALTLSVAHEASHLARVTASAPTTTQPAPQQTKKKGWIGRHPVLFGALVGFGAGCVLGASRVGGSQDTFFNALDEFACPVVGGMGAGAGSVIGWSVSRTR